MYETLAGSRIGATVTAITETRLLRIDRGGLFELLADHTDLLQGIFSMLLAPLGQDDLEHRLDALTAAHGDRAAVALDDRLHDRQSQSRSAGVQA